MKTYSYLCRVNDRQTSPIMTYRNEKDFSCHRYFDECLHDLLREQKRSVRRYFPQMLLG